MNKEADSIPPSVEILEKFKNDWTPEIYHRLLLFAAARCKSLTWHGVLGGPAEEGREAADFVQDAVQLFLVGRRKWNPENCDLKTFLEGTIRSITGHSSEHKENKITIRNSPHIDEDGNERAITSQAVDRQPPYEEKEEVAMREALMWEFMDFLTDEPQLLALFEAIYDGVTKRAKIAERLGIKAKEVTNLRKRLDKKSAEFRMKQNLEMKN